jgi:hypothetical protein
LDVSSEPKPRRQKFVRGEADPLRLTPRDTAILADVAEYRFLNTEQLLSLHEGSRRNITERLSLLFQHGYLDRPKVQKAANLASAHVVYSLDRKGVDVLAKDAQERGGILRRVQEVKHTSPLIAHALMISQFRVCLTLALKGRPSVKLIRWTQGNDLKTLLRHRGENPELVPDAFFILDTSEFKYPCFLEADRGTMTEERFVNKLRLYWRHYREERFNKTLGISHFRVLTITPNEKRAENLCRAAKEADDRKQGSGMFLFMSETAYGTTRPDAILQAAWKCPKFETMQGIIH